MAYYIMKPEYNSDGVFQGLFQVRSGFKTREWEDLAKAKAFANLKRGQVFDRTTGRLLHDYTPIENLVPHEDRSVRQLRKSASWVASQVFCNA